MYTLALILVMEQQQKQQAGETYILNWCPLLSISLSLSLALWISFFSQCLASAVKLPFFQSFINFTSYEVIKWYITVMATLMFLFLLPSLLLLLAQFSFLFFWCSLIQIKLLSLNYNMMIANRERKKISGKKCQIEIENRNRTHNYKKAVKWFWYYQ